ncbi:MAG: hypothetical protein ACC661_07625, partial [Verrucomicrobiales bacterium]
IIAAIAVPNIGRINDAANQSKDRRNAQNLASVTAAAQAAGLDFVGSATTVPPVTTLVITGATVNEPGNPFNGTFFGVPNLGATEKLGAEVYLGVQDGVLTYNGAP